MPPSALRLLASTALVATVTCATAHPTETSPPPPTPPAASSAPPPAPPPAPPAPLAVLPRGGRTIFPKYRLVGFCGTPGAPELGELTGNLVVKAKELVKKAAEYEGSREILPVFELIAVVVQSAPGPDGMYRRRVPDSVVEEYLRLARQWKGLLLLNIQPGHSDFLTEAKAFERFLREPDVGLALDPEWAMTGKHRPGAFWGQTTAAAITGVAEYLSGIVAASDLPEKVLVFHEVVRDVVKDETSMHSAPGVVIVKSVDGLGPAAAKVKTYANLMERTATGVHAGFKLFFYEDTMKGGHLMSAKRVLALSPQPEYVMYE